MRLPAGYARLVSSLIARGPAATRFGVTLGLVGRSSTKFSLSKCPEVVPRFILYGRIIMRLQMLARNAPTLISFMGQNGKCFFSISTSSFR